MIGITKSLSLSQKRMLLAAALLVVLVIAVVLGAVMKSINVKLADDEYKTLRKVVTERFEFEPHDKNIVYNTYVRNFYSSASNPVSYTIMFMPSVTDVACTNFSDHIQDSIPCGTEEGSAPLDSVSLRDDRSAAGLRPYEVCGSRSAATGPLDPQDAYLRILTNIYSLRKTCVQLPYTSLKEAEDGSADRLTFSLPVESQATLFFALARPVFLTTSASYIYAVKFLKDQAYEYGYGYTEPGTSSMQVELERVHEDMMYEPGTRAVKKRLQDVYADADNGLMNATLYYINYEHPVRRGLSDVKFDTINDHVLTMVIPVTKKNLIKPDDWVNLDDPDVRVTFNNENNTLRVILHGQRPFSWSLGEMRIDPHGYVVIVYATNTVTMCYMSRGRVQLRRVEDVHNLDIRPERKSDISAALEDAGAAPPASCHPCSKFAIPNLYDVYTKLVAFA